ncbi:MAG: TM2 domain-containing protein [Flavobacteriales bacterium]|nr:TM2 domain-containing protein [Flavobacteriales bacterium]
MPARTLLPLFCAVLMWLAPRSSSAAGPFQDRSMVVLELLPVDTTTLLSDHREPQRLVAATLTLTLGVFAAHRLYFGTDVKVPIIYGLTFGGFGVLVLIDLAHIIFTKDLKPYMNNNKVFMWSTERSDPLTPP